jgi:hypothetical protein
MKISGPTNQPEERLIASLRHESNFVKDCFTRFSFQVLSVSAVALGLILEFAEGKPYFGYAAILIVMLNLAVIRIENHKYFTANRNSGYELYLESTRDLDNSNSCDWHPSMRNLGWEQAMQAWRVVQTSVFAELYTTRPFFRNKLRRKYRCGRRWFNIDEVTRGAGAGYYSGSYLKAMSYTLLFVAIVGLLAVFASDLVYYKNSKEGFETIMNSMVRL